VKIMKLYFIRHGQTDWNQAGRIQGSCDIHLNSTGLKQAEELCKKLFELDYPISRIYTSKQMRALQTATVLSEASELELFPVDGLEEVNLGLWEGLSWSDVREKYPKEYEDWYHNRRYSNAHTGETYQEVVVRAMAAIHRIILENEAAVAIVTHNAVIMCLQCYLTDTPFHDMKRFKAANTSITILESDAFLNKIIT
jgi:probable phosphoglycerate mutase